MTQIKLINPSQAAPSCGKKASKLNVFQTDLLI